MIRPAPIAERPASPARERIDAADLGSVDRRASVIYSHLILGAGASGLSLAWYLLEAGVEGPIALVDRRATYRNDRTWCFWDVEPTPFNDLATHAWPLWSVIDDRGFAADRGSGRYRYLRIRAIDFYRRALDRLASDDRVDLYLDEPIHARRVLGDRVEVETPNGPIRGRLAFDSARPPAHLAESSPAGRVALVQHFLGQTVRASGPVFDTDRPILMDFRVDQRDGPRFVYVLPLSPDVALVENTYLFPAPVSASRHRIEISEYLGKWFGLGAFEVIEEESGRIPMTVGRPRSEPGSPLVPIGLAGGAARPSSGYAFLRIQRQTRRLAETIAAGRTTEPPEPGRVAPRKYDFLDAVFLQALADRPADAPRLFARMFDRVEPDALVRFLADRGRPRDDARLIASLPKRPFLGAALRSATTWAPLCLGRG